MTTKRNSTYKLWETQSKQRRPDQEYYRKQSMENQGFEPDDVKSSKTVDNDLKHTSSETNNECDTQTPSLETNISSIDDKENIADEKSDVHSDDVTDDARSQSEEDIAVDEESNDTRLNDVEPIDRSSSLPNKTEEADQKLSAKEHTNKAKEAHFGLHKFILLDPSLLVPKVIVTCIIFVKKVFLLTIWKAFWSSLTTMSAARDVDEADTLLEQNEANGGPKVLVERSLFTQKNFDENFEAGSRPSPTIGQIVKKKLMKCKCSGICVKQFIFSIFPFIGIMKNYNIKEDLMGDVVSGLTVGIMHIPQGMAYGMLTTLPPVYGLYMSFFPVLIYFFFGSSKHVSMGTFAVACLMIGSAVSKGINAHHQVPAHSSSGLIRGNQSDLMFGNEVVNHSIGTNDTTTSIMNVTTTMKTLSSEADETMSDDELKLRLEFAMSVTFMVGVIQLLMGFFRLGFITVYLSDPLISGFTTGAACHVFTSQIKHIFGVKTNRYSGVFKLVYTYRDFFTNIESTNIVTLLLSVVCVVILYCTGRFINQNPKLKPKMFMPVPIELIMVVLGTLTSYLIRLNEDHNVVIVSDIPTGLPVPNLTAFSRIGEVISDAIALAIVIFAISISMGKLLAKKHDYEVDANQELIAYGISTVVSSFFSSPAPSASLSRSLVQERVGGRTQVAGLFSCCLLLIVLLAIGPYFRTLPNCVLASIIIVALRGMFLQVLDLKKLWSVSLIDFFVWIVSFLATVLLDVDLGLGTAVIFNILTVVCRSQRPYATLLGQIPGTDIYRDMNVYQEAREVVGVKIFRFEHSLFFVNTEHFKTLLYKKTTNPRTLKIAMKKREAKLEKLRKKEITVTGDNVPDVNVPSDMMEMEIDTKHGDVKVSIIATDNIKSLPNVEFHTIIIDCSPWSFVDSMGVKVLTAVIGEYKAVGVKVILANCKGGIREMFEKTKFYDTLDHSSIYVSLHDAVIHALHLETPTTVLPESGRANGTGQHEGSMIEGSQRGDGSYMEGSENVDDYNLDFIDDESVKGKGGKHDKLLGKSKA